MNKLLTKDFLLKRALPIFGGALIGYSYYYFIGCYNGACPITSNPYISTGYGALIGLILAMPTKKKKIKDEENVNEN